MILYQYPPSAPIPPVVGGATEAKQDDQIIIAQALNDVIGEQADVAQPDPTLDSTVIATLKGVNENLRTIDFSTAAKQDLLLAELQLKADLTETQPVSLASVPLPTGAATAAKQDLLLAELQLKADLTETQPVSLASIPLATGASTEAKQDAEAVLIGAVTETAPASDTASSGLNGRLQRIAQRITSLIALIPTSLGQKTMANSFAVTLASDQSALSITQTALAASYQEDLTVSNSVETFTAPAGAKTVVIQAPSSNTVNLRVRLSGTATTTSGYVFEPGRSEVFPFSGNVSYIAESGSGQAINAHFGA